MRRYSPILAAAIACAMPIAATRRLEDEDRGDPLPTPPSPVRSELKVHKHTREIERRLRQKARREAKARGERSDD